MFLRRISLHDYPSPVFLPLKSILQPQEIKKSKTHRSAGNSQFNFTSGSTHQLSKLLTNSLQKCQSIVLGQSFQEVLDGITLILTTGVFLELLDDLRLVGCRESGCLHDGSELSIFLEDVVEGLERAGNAVESRGLAGCGVL